MKVFISWSGDLSRALAVELRQWLPMVVHQVDAWISGRDIAPGQRWALVLGKELEQSVFAIICLTSDNKESPWILFEAGAVARSLEASVVPLLFGISPSELDGPLSQFQSVKADRAGMKELVKLLYEKSNSGLSADQRDLVFAQLWPILEKRLASLSEQTKTATTIESPSDLVTDLAQSPERSARQLFSLDKLEQLKVEKERLQSELEYLESEERKLTRQDAPISLVERAIEPTQNRLDVVKSTLRNALDKAFAMLTLSQIEILRSLVTPRGVRLMKPTSATQNQLDLERLTQMALIRVEKKGGEKWIEIGHDLIADYVAEKYGASVIEE